MHRLPSDVAVRCSRRSRRAAVIVPASGSRTMRPSASEPCASDGICCLPEGPDGTDAPIPASDYRSRSADGRIHRRLTPVSHAGAGRGAPPLAGSHRRSGGKKRPVRTGPVSGEVPQRRGTDAPAAHAAQTPSSKLCVAFLACCEKRGPAPMRRADQASAYDQVSDRADGFPGKITLRQGDNGVEHDAATSFSQRKACDGGYRRDVARQLVRFRGAHGHDAGRRRKLGEPRRFRMGRACERHGIRFACGRVSPIGGNGSDPP